MRRSPRKQPALSWGFWRGCAAIAVLSVAGFVTLTSGSYKNRVAAPPVEPVPAATMVLIVAGVAFAALWGWERYLHRK